MKASRRSVLGGAAALLGSWAQLAVRLGAAGPLASSLACKASPTPEATVLARQPGFLPQLCSLEQALLVEDLAELIVPETDTPGARRAGVAAFIEAMLRDVYDDEPRAAFLAGVDELDRAAQRRWGQRFCACDGARQSELVAELVAGTRAALERASGEDGASGVTPEPARFFSAFRELVIDGFCRSKLGATRVLQYEPVPGDYEACVPRSAVGRAWATQ